MSGRLFCLPLLLALVSPLQTAAAPASSAPIEEPPAPVASPSVRRLLVEAEQLAQSGNLVEALTSSDRAVTVAQQAGDAAGRVLAQQGRAQFLNALGRSGEAVAACREAVAAWEQAGDGPGQVEALTTQCLLLVQQQHEQAQLLMKRAISLARPSTRSASLSWYETARRANRR